MGQMQYPNISFPIRIDVNGQIAWVDEPRNIDQLISQLLVLSPGERVNRPTLGCGLKRLVFDANGPELEAATQFLIQGSLQEWLGSLIVVQSVEVSHSEDQLLITVVYTVKRTGETRTLAFTPPA